MDDAAFFDTLHADLVVRLSKVNGVKKLAADFASGAIGWSEYLKAILKTPEVASITGIGIDVLSTLAGSSVAALPFGAVASPALTAVVGAALTAVKNHYTE